MDVQLLQEYTFNKAYPEEYTGDLYVGRHANLWVTYFPYSYLNTKRRATASVPLKYNTCERMELDYGAFNSGLIREYADRIDFYLNNFRSDTIRTVTDTIRIVGATTRPTFTFVNRSAASNKAAAPTVADTRDETTRTLTLAVSHLGPLDLSVSCSGPYAEERIADAPQPQPRSSPSSPAPTTATSSSKPRTWTTRASAAAAPTPTTPIPTSAVTRATDSPTWERPPVPPSRRSSSCPTPWTATTSSRSATPPRGHHPLPRGRGRQRAVHAAHQDG